MTTIYIRKCDRCKKEWRSDDQAGMNEQRQMLTFWRNDGSSEFISDLCATCQKEVGIV